MSLSLPPLSAALSHLLQFTLSLPQALLSLSLSLSPRHRDGSPEPDPCLGSLQRRTSPRVSFFGSFRFCVPKENVAASSESYSWVADEKACSSNKQNSSLIKGVELQNSFCSTMRLKIPSVPFLLLFT
ncbi:uncharacterized protein LOC112090772 [Morus notabilis]|uniref:uncharacterized protein LOC112090772 n=1 Tax=Morus notabilis TaxID=981085 RepID=UPI000CED66B2|nr:uncharacterized protein LOC112090772 [Morus notabilis]